jgi:CheY-like chemotaxis protein
MFMDNSAEKIPILYIDDNPNERFFIQNVLERLNSNFQLIYLNSLKQGMDYLSGIGPFADRETYPLPRFILLDYSLGPKTGADLLRWMRGQPEFALIPTAVYSNSQHPDCIGISYEAGANHFLNKPESIQRLEEVMRVLEQSLSSQPPSFELLLQLPEYRRAPSGEN